MFNALLDADSSLLVLAIIGGGLLLFLLLLVALVQTKNQRMSRSNRLITQLDAIRIELGGK